ncbi:MAG TPA: hypothetical protein DCO75_10420 [Fibrobacteres bacterium]|nr:hypothetical protein [Fibrobacterota bacterium]
MPHIRILIFVIVTAMIFSCSDKSVSGTTDETVVSSVRVFNPDLTPAVNAAVKVFSVGDTTQIPVYETTTDSKGQYKIEVDYGVYNISVKKDSLAAFQDSVIYHKTYSTLSNDTLDSVHVIYGLVVMEGMQDPRTSTVQILGSDMYSNVSSNGVFVINGVAPGKYTLRAVTTLADYTPTFEHLTITTAAQDTIRDTITMIYTGIPVIDKIHAVYDTVRGIVHLSWDTTDYAYLRDFLIYRDTMPVLTPSTAPLGTSYSCSYSDSLGSTICNNMSTVIYRVAVRSKNLAIGETMTDVEITSVKPCSVSLNKSLMVTLGVPCTLSANITGYAGSHVTYAWDIGNKGVFTNSLYPETTFVVKDTVTNDYQCVMKTFIDKALIYTDTAHLATNFTWAKQTAGFLDSIKTTGISTIVFDNKMYAFVLDSAGGKTALYQTPDGITWAKVTDSLPALYSVAMFYNKPVVYQNKICIADDSAYIRTSSDAVNWNRVSTNPVFDDVSDPGGTYLVGNYFVYSKYYPPVLFVDNTNIYCKAFLSINDIFQSTDLIAWDTTKNNSVINVIKNYVSNVINGDRFFISDYTELNGLFAVMGVSWFVGSGNNPWLYIRNPDGRTFMSKAPYPSDKATFISFYFNLEMYKNNILSSHKGSDTLWAITDTTWRYCGSLPSEVYNSAYSYSAFNNGLYLISTAGVYKAKTN